MTAMTVVRLPTEPAADRDRRHAAAFRELEGHIRTLARQKGLLFALPLEEKMGDLELFATMQLGARIDDLLRCYDELADEGSQPPPAA
jgi:hypothetical protein